MRLFPGPTMRQLLVDAGAPEPQLDAAAAALLARAAETVPWYVRAATGFGAWVSACMLLGFLAATGLFHHAVGSLVVGFGTAAASVAVARSARSEFPRQLAVVLGLASQGFIALGLGEAGLGEKGLPIVSAMVAAVLFWLHPDPVHRFLSAAGALGLLLVGAAVNNAPRAAEVLTLLGLGVVLLLGRVASTAPGRVASTAGRVASTAAGRVASTVAGRVASTVASRRLDFAGERVRLLRAAWLLVVLFTLTVSLAAPLREQWVSPLSGLALTAFWGAQVWLDTSEMGARPERQLLLLPALAVVGYVSLAAPGVPAALVVLGLALRERDAVQLLAGAVFLALYLGGYYLNLALPLWHKAGVLLGSGLLALGARAVVLRMLPRGKP